MDSGETGGALGRAKLQIRICVNDFSSQDGYLVNELSVIKHVTICACMQ